MTRIRKPGTSQKSEVFHRPHVTSALLVSLQSVAWTVVASTASVVVGIQTRTAVLVAFGAIGIVDAVGSIALAYHFHHALRHDELSEKLERLAHRIVLIGLFSVGCAAIIGGLVRLTMDESSSRSNTGVALAAASLVALVLLSARKQQVARRVSSKALSSDGHLSAIGAVQAAVTLAGTATTRWLGWDWADAVATTVVGCVAATLAVSTWRAEHRPRRIVARPVSAPKVATLLVIVIAVADSLLGARLVLIGLLVAGPAVAAVSLRLRPTAAISAACIVLALALGAPDHIWLTTEHLMWLGAVAIVSIANTAVVAVIARHVRVGTSAGSVVRTPEGGSNGRWSARASHRDRGRLVGVRPDESS